MLVLGPEFWRRFVAAPCHAAEWVGWVAVAAWGGIARCMRAAKERVASRRPTPVPPKDGDFVELLDSKGKKGKKGKKGEVEYDDAESFVTPAPSYHSGTSAPTYTSSLAPPYAEPLSPVDEEAERRAARLPPGAEPAVRAPPMPFAPLEDDDPYIPVINGCAAPDPSGALP